MPGTAYLLIKSFVDLPQCVPHPSILHQIRYCSNSQTTSTCQLP